MTGNKSNPIGTIIKSTSDARACSEPSPPTPETHQLTQRIQLSINQIDDIDRRLREVEDNLFGQPAEKNAKDESQPSANGFLQVAHSQLGYMEKVLDSIARITERLQTL